MYDVILYLICRKLGFTDFVDQNDTLFRNSKKYSAFIMTFQMEIFEPIFKIYQDFPLLHHRKVIRHYRKAIRQKALVRSSPNLVRLCKNKFCENKIKPDWPNCLSDWVNFHISPYFPHFHIFLRVNFCFCVNKYFREKRK